ncbi:hypothetical protein [Photobacterium indicum]|nr:hypothetical protein [Photobacterium indicum]
MQIESFIVRDIHWSKRHYLSQIHEAALLSSVLVGYDLGGY